MICYVSERWLVVAMKTDLAIKHVVKQMEMDEQEDWRTVDIRFFFYSRVISMNCFILKEVLAVLVTLFLAKQVRQEGKGEDVGSILTLQFERCFPS